MEDKSEPASEREHPSEPQVDETSENDNGILQSHWIDNVPHHKILNLPSWPKKNSTGSNSQVSLFTYQFKIFSFYF